MQFFTYVSNGKECDALRLNPQRGGLCGARLTSPQDLLTGYGYQSHQARPAHYGARYMDHELMTMWQSVAGPKQDVNDF